VSRENFRQNSDSVNLHMAFSQPSKRRLYIKGSELLNGRRSGRHMRRHSWSGKGQARAKDLFTTVWRPATACQSTCLEENARERTPPVGVHGRPSRHENWSNAQRHNRNGYWSNARRHNRNDHWSNIPQEAARIRPQLEPETCLTQHPTVGSLWPQYSAARIHRRTEKCPGSDAGALQADDTSLLPKGEPPALPHKR
jgi:hypothetical protein